MNNQTPLNSSIPDLSDDYRGTTALISQKALCNNVKRLSELVKRPICIPLKANAYGHGIRLCARLLANVPEVDAFAVAVLAEALLLRQAGHRKDIWLLEGVHDEAQLQIAQQHNFVVVIQNELQLAQAKQLGKQLSTQLRPDNPPLKLWLKVDTGMHRLGLSLTTALSAADKLATLPGIQLDGIMSHYACADESQHPANLAQIEQMRHIQDYTDSRDGLRSSFGNSAAVLNTIYQSSTATSIDFPIGDIIRPGASSYGLSPYADRTGHDLGLSPVMTLQSRVLATRDIAAGEGVGYGHIWQAEAPMLIATIGIGYGDGFSRETPSNWPVIAHHHGRDIPGTLVGRVSMDMVTLAFPIDSGVSIGDSITIFGDNAKPADTLAQHRGSLSYTSTTMLTRRIPRVAVA